MIGDSVGACLWGDGNWALNSWSSLPRLRCSMSVPGCAQASDPFHGDPKVSPHNQGPNSNRRIQDLAWRIGGPQGSGVDTAASIFSRACGIASLHLHGRREYYSNIMGRHSYYDVRASEMPHTSHRDAVDMLTTFEPETLLRHAMAVIDDGAIVNSAGGADVPIDSVTYLDPRAQIDLAAYLAEHDLPPTSAGMLDCCRRRGVTIFQVSYSDVIDRLANALDVPNSIAQRARNTIAVAVSCALLRFEAKFVEKALEKQWPGRQKIIDMNVEAVRQAYGYVAERYSDTPFGKRLRPAPTAEQRILLNGNQAVALGKLAGGMTVQTYYPISPATDESTFLEAHEEFRTKDGEEASVLVIQTEDEISAVTMAAGAALTGARSATATSGPGFALMTEGIGWAGINEVPLVITLWQRGGPSTGMPTRTEQGDLLFACNAGHGEFPKIVMSSGDVEEAFHDAAQAFNYAERYQTVVIHIVDKGLASTTRTLPPFDLDKVRIERGLIAKPRGNDAGNGTPFKRFEWTESGISPRTLLGQEGNAHWMTGGEHTEIGRVTEDPVVRERNMEKRARKMELAASEIPADEKLRVYGDPEAELTILSWGSNKGAILEALDGLKANDIQARLVQVRIFAPFPANELEELLSVTNPLVVVEANFSGQLMQLLRQHTGLRPDYLIVKYNGRPISGEELLGALDTVNRGEAPERIVLRNPNQ